MLDGGVTNSPCAKAGLESRRESRGGDLSAPRQFEPPEATAAPRASQDVVVEHLSGAFEVVAHRGHGAQHLDPVRAASVLGRLKLARENFERLRRGLEFELQRSDLGLSVHRFAPPSMVRTARSSTAEEVRSTPPAPSPELARRRAARELSPRRGHFLAVASLSSE